MKLLTVISVMVFSYVSSIAQIQIRPLPEPGFEKRIRDHVFNMEIIDTHEHLGSQDGWKNSPALGIMMLLHQYADDDIKSAGMGKPEFAELMTGKYTEEEKWHKVKPYWEDAKSTGYGRCVLLSVDKLFGIKDLNDSTILVLHDKLKDVYETDWYKTVLQDKAKIKYSILDDGQMRLKGDMFRNVEKFDAFIRIFSKEDIEKLANRYKVQVSSLDDYERMLNDSFADAVKRGIIGVKSALAYHRILDYRDAPLSEAEAVFRKMTENPDKTFTFDEVKPFQDYIMHRIIRLARKYDLPIQFHTGLQAGDGNYIRNSNPALLANLFLEYRDVKFVIFHGGYPYGGEFGSLAKNFRNVYIDLCWLYIISPSYSERYLHEWIETVPANKIMAFGGDFENVENIYGHSLMAREVVSKVLIDKVRTGYLTEKEAIEIADKILYRNAADLFRLE